MDRKCDPRGLSHRPAPVFGLATLALVVGLAVTVGIASSAFAVEGMNPHHGLLPAQPPYTPDQRIMISDPPDGVVLDRSPERITVNFRRFDFEDLQPSSLELWIDGVEYSERLKFWTDVAWVELPPGVLGPGEHQIVANIRGGPAGGPGPNAVASLYSNAVTFSIFIGPCLGGCPWPISPTDEPHVVSNLMEDWQDFGGSPYFHEGLDIRADAGTDVHACAGGIVVKKVNYNSGDPRYFEVAIQDGTGLIWQYHHLEVSSITVSPGDSVAQGQVIGQVVEWTEFMNGWRYNHVHLNTVRWQGGGPIPGPYVDGWRYYNPLIYLTRGSYADVVVPEEFDVYFGFNENPVPVAAESDAGDPSLSGPIDVVARLREERTPVGSPDTLGQPYNLGLYDLSWSVSPLDTPCGMGWVPRTRLARFDMVPGGTTVAGNEDALKKIYRQFLFYPSTVPYGAKFDYDTQRFPYVLSNTKNGFPDDVNGYWDTAHTTSLGAIYPDGHYVVKIYAQDFSGNETVTSVPVTLSNGKTWNGICPPYIASLRVLQGPYLMTLGGGLYSAPPLDVPLAFGPVVDGSAFAILESSGWPAWNIDLPDRGIRVAIGLLTGRHARVEYIPLLGDVIVTLDAEAQVLPIGGVFNPNLPSSNPVSLRLSTRLARDPAGPAMIGRPAALGDPNFDLVMAKPILVNGEPMTLRLGGGPIADAQWQLDAAVSVPASESSSPGAMGLEVQPNPFIAGGTFALTVTAGRAIEVNVYDSSGRRVRRLFDGQLPAGVHRLRWDARDDAGTPLPAGIYFASTRGGDTQARRMLVLLK